MSDASKAVVVCNSDQKSDSLRKLRVQSVSMQSRSVKLFRIKDLTSLTAEVYKQAIGLINLIFLTILGPQHQASSISHVDFCTRRYLPWLRTSATSSNRKEDNRVHDPYFSIYLFHPPFQIPGLSQVYQLGFTNLSTSHPLLYIVLWGHLTRVSSAHRTHIEIVCRTVELEFRSLSSFQYP